MSHKNYWELLREFFCNTDASFFLNNYCLHKDIFTRCVLLQICLHKTFISASSLRRQIVKFTKNNTEAAELYPTLTNWLLVWY